MARFCCLTLLLALTVPAFAKPHNQKQPIRCSELWTAVSETLGDARNYNVVVLDNEGMKSNFVVVGGLFSAMNLVQLKPTASGCDLRLRFGFTGADDEAAFRSRVNRALKKLYAAKASAQPVSGAAQ